MPSGLSFAPRNCADCGESLPSPRAISRRFCEACTAARNKQRAAQWRSRNRIAFRETVSVWKTKHADLKKDHRENTRARKEGVFVERVYRAVVWMEHSGLCGICGVGVSFHSMELDHIVPCYQGGRHEYANCQPAHKYCNRAKNGRDRLGNPNKGSRLIKAPIQKELPI